MKNKFTFIKKNVKKQNGKKILQKLQKIPVQKHIFLIFPACF